MRVNPVSPTEQLNLDFGDAQYTKQGKGEKPANWFLRDFLDGVYDWNPDFA